MGLQQAIGHVTPRTRTIRSRPIFDFGVPDIDAAAGRAQRLGAPPAVAANERWHTLAAARRRPLGRAGPRRYT